VASNPRPRRTPPTTSPIRSVLRVRRKTVEASATASLQMREPAGVEPVPSFEGQLPSERVLWSGRPAPLAYAYRRLSPAFPVGLGLLVFTVLWELDALTTGRQSVWTVAGVVFLLIGLHGVLLRPLLLIRAARRRAYAVTDRRVIRLKRSHGQALIVEAECAWRPPFAAVRVAPGGGSVSVSDVTFAGAPVCSSRWGWWGVGEAGDSLACLVDAPSALLALAQLRAGLAAPAGAWATGARTP
jgi:hypothetical protein